MFYRFVNLIVSCFFISSCFGVVLDENTSAGLEDFFRCMIEDSEGGYVLYEKKPVCITGFHVVDTFYGECELHKQNVCLREGAKYLNKFKSLLKNDNLMIHVYDQTEGPNDNWIRILFINRSLFLTTVKENLSLFQYVLGPEVTPEGLLDKLTCPKESFHSVLKKDEVLIGIILGFGTQNSLRGARFENIQKKLVAAEELPFKNAVYNQENGLKLCKHLLIQTGAFRAGSSHLDLGFSYNSLKEEFDGLFQQMEVSSEKLSSERPYFIFGRLKEHKESEDLIDELEKTQTKIQHLLKSSDFFKTVVQSFFQENTTLLTEDYPKESSAFNQNELEQLPELIAANIWDNLLWENESYIEGFFEGMRNANEPNHDSKFSNYHILKQLSIARSNIELANEFFLELEKNPNVTALYPQKIYYSCIEEGDGRSLEDQVKLRVHCTIKTPKNKVLCDTWSSGQPMALDLTKTIDGFRLGMSGMRVGEIREIFIHPSVAYEIYTTLEKGIYLKARVQLVSIDSDETSTPHTTTPFDFTEELALLETSDFAQISRQEGFLAGQKIWFHYQKGLFVSPDKIIHTISHLKSNPSHIDLEAPSNQDLINHLHWHIYKQQ